VVSVSFVLQGKPDKHHLVLFFLCSGYLAPEYALGGQLTMKADVYSFGVLILEMVSGRSSAKPSWGGTQKLLLEWVRRFYFCNLQIYFLVAFKIIFYIAIMITRMLELFIVWIHFVTSIFCFLLYLLVIVQEVEYFPHDYVGNRSTSEILHFCSE